MGSIAKEKWLSGNDRLRKYEKCLQSPIFQMLFCRLAFGKGRKGRAEDLPWKCFADGKFSNPGRAWDFNLYLGVLRSSLALVPGVRSVFFVILLVGIISLGSTLNPIEDEKEKYREIFFVCCAALRSVGRRLLFGQDGEKIPNA